MRMTTAQALVKFLNEQYVRQDGEEWPLFEGIMTIFGHGNVVGLGQALAEDAGHLRVYQGRNEQGMAHAAAAFSKQRARRQVMACTSSVGPGAANMVTAAATATANQIPLLLLPGDTFASRQPDPVLQQIEQTYDLSISTNDAFRPVSKYWDRVNRPEQLMTAMIQAVRVLTDQSDTGAVTIALPQDVQGEAYDFPEVFFKKRVHTLHRRSPEAEELELLLQHIKTSKQPLIICGGGVRYSRAGDTLASFARAFGIPFAETQAGKGAVESDHPLNLGGLGVTGNAAANLYAKDADLVIGLGTRLTDFTTASKSLFAEDASIVQVNLSAFHAQKLDAHQVIGDVKAVLEALEESLAAESFVADTAATVQRLKADWHSERSRLAGIAYKEGIVPEVAGHLDDALPDYVTAFGGALTQTEVLCALNEWLPTDAIVVGASGSLPGDMQRVWETKAKDGYHMEYGFSCMGYEIAGAFGAKLAAPEREVFAMVGDGSYQMLHSELVTSLQEGQKINVVLFDNAGFGCINNLQMGNGMPSFGTEFRQRQEATGQLDGDVMVVDYAKSAAGYGVDTYSVRTLEELKEAIKMVKTSSVSTLIDIKVLPKTMTDGYHSWWNVGVAEVAKEAAIEASAQERKKSLGLARPY
ncbi:3D-(3,5/4)-trihydroxycyclohexane-1,2-dione acylhydrolase (decyclizing) [Aureibacillus halotolerans]|uniref:3D-(3,5/4)-trihydroxycyclohexane-1,2-dione hydrolase n=1 Tax=Aureibacillus halotolerans TaxID=1508390 RepID=A0A4R6U8R1_9BACI|nr:3D-(3,5/4)-trihydroxycyclohexane-1,2-dione acylhydrolase (decyclizing) [Aureibacillus halotolerans]TDQ41025.1 3D-(3,5/4)-trihydroxycyclohexane-1,2-dione hydrolase [Aureibacillus halotolerans]